MGFVDYNLENFHANKFIELFHGELQQHGIEVAYCYGMIEEPSREWAKRQGRVAGPSGRGRGEGRCHRAAGARQR